MGRIATLIIACLSLTAAAAWAHETGGRTSRVRSHRVQARHVRDRRSSRTVSQRHRPVNTALPVVTGTAVQGQTLTTTTGSWSNSPSGYGYQWQDCDSAGLNCSATAGASSSSYTVQPTDVGHTIRAVVTATNAGGSASASSLETAVVVPLAPTNTALPTVSGTTQQGNVLTASAGSWTGSPSSFSYQWQRCLNGTCSSITGAGAQTYTLGTSDVGDTVKVIVTATNAGGSTSATSTATAVVAAAPSTSPPQNTTRPTISGTPQQGSTLTAANGSWSGSPAPTFTYQWQDCVGSTCTNITGAGGQTYVLASTDVGDTVDVIVTAKNSAGSASATSAVTVTVTAPSSGPLVGDTNLEANVDSNSAGQAQAWQYSASAGGTSSQVDFYVDASSTATAGQLGIYTDASGSPGNLIGSASFTPKAGAWNTVNLNGMGITAGTKYWLAELGTNGTLAFRDHMPGTGTSQGSGSSSLSSLPSSWAAGSNWSGTSPASFYVTAGGTAAPPGNTAAPSISGTAQQGDMLTANPGTWSGAAPMSYTYVWSDGTSGKTDTLGASDVGTSVAVAVTASNSAGTAKATSANVGPVQPAPPPVAPSNTTAPTISGTAQQGDTLTANPGVWSGTAPISYSYAWSDGVTGQTDMLGASDVGKSVSVVVTASNSVGSAKATSAGVGPVTAAPASGTYQLPSDRTYDWDPGLNAVGGIPDRTTIYKTISPSGGDDTATIQAALDSCPANEVVQLTAGVFHITGLGLSLTTSCTLRGAGPGPGNWPQDTAATGTGGTYLEKPSGTGYPVIVMGPRWGTTHALGSAINLTSDAVRGTKTATVANASSLTAGQLVIVDETTDPTISHWNSGDPENNSGWFEEPNRPLGDVMRIASVSGNTVTFTTDFPVTYQVAQSAHLVPETSQTDDAGVEDLYYYGGGGGDGGGGIHMWNCADCWVKHVEASYNDEPINIDESFGVEVRDSYIHDAPGGLNNSSSSYGIALNWYTSDTLVENNIVMYFDKMEVMRSAGGGNVFGYNYMDDGADLNGQWFEDQLDGNHMTTPHYELFEGNGAANADTDDRWGNAAYITYFRNDLTGQLRDFPNSGPYIAGGLTQYDYWYSFVGNVLGTPADIGNFSKGYESVGGNTSTGWPNAVWALCYQAHDNVPDGGKCLSTVLRDGNYDYLTKEVHWHGIGGTGVTNGLTPPANSQLPASLYLTSKPAFFGSDTWPWIDGSNASNPLPGALPARQRFDAGTPNAVQ